jgi:hypothetical protein
VPDDAQDSPAEDGSANDAGYTDATVAFLMYLSQHTEPSDAAWHERNKHQYQIVLRDPTKRLIAGVRDRYIEPLNSTVAGRRNQASMLRKNYNKGFFPYYWFAFYDPKAGSRKYSPQLYFYLDGESQDWHYGFSLSNSPPEIRERLRAAIRENANVVAEYLSTAPAGTRYSIAEWTELLGSRPFEPPGGDDDEAKTSIFRWFQLDELVAHDRTLVDEVGKYFVWAWPFFIASLTGIWPIGQIATIPPDLALAKSGEPPEPPERVRVSVNKILRDTDLARWVKARHNFECQICGHTIRLPDGKRYAESHHLRHLGQPHNGPDISGNIICVCPNHHTELDYFALRILPGQLRNADGHTCLPEYIKYHNRFVFRGRKGSSKK